MSDCGAPSRRRRGLGIFTGVALAAALAGAPDAGAAVFGRDRGVDVVGLVGVGWTVAEAPLGVRYFWSHRAGMDLALGLESEDVGPSRRTDLVLNGGYLHAMAPGRRVNLFIRPGLRFRNTWTEGSSTTSVGVSVSIDVEVFLSDRVSVGTRTGIFLDSISPPGNAANRASFGTTSGGFMRAGMHAYFGDRSGRSRRP